MVIGCATLAQSWPIGLVILFKHMLDYRLSSIIKAHSTLRGVGSPLRAGGQGGLVTANGCVPTTEEEIRLMVLTAQPKTRNFFTIKEHETSFH